MFQNCISDLGSQLQAGANQINTFLSDMETQKYMEANGMKSISFQHYAKGNSSQGALIESLVKQVKHLIFKSVGNNILDFFDFEYLIMKAVCLINKRPISFKDMLRDNDTDVPTFITPEIILRGYETTSLNIIPNLQTVEDEYDMDINAGYSKLRKIRQRLIDIYHREFITNLINQATDKHDRYRPVKHDLIKPNDVVMLVDPLLKQYNYPLGRVVSTQTNSLGEVTRAIVHKGCTKEKVDRHVTSLILLMRPEPDETRITPEEKKECEAEMPILKRSKRLAAKKCRQRNLELLND